MPLFFYFISFFFHTYNTLNNHSHILTSLNICHSLIAEQLSGRHAPPWGAESGFELGPALQRADMLPAEPCRTLNWAMPHP